MKKIVLIIAIGLFFTLQFGCDEDKTLDIEPIGQPTESNFFRNETEMTQAVFGVYQKLSFFYKFQVQNFLQRTDLLPSDDLTRNNSGPFENLSLLDQFDSRIGLTYQYTYQLIARANTLLQKIEENESFAYTNQPELANVHRGEALFLRSLMYLKLWNTFGTAPLVTERIVDLGNAFPPNSVGTQLLDQAVQDLTEAQNFLPDVWDDANLGRATSNSAKGLLVKVLVFRGSVTGNNADFAQALTVFNSMSGVSLAPNYTNNFDAQTENNRESLFEFQAARNSDPKINDWLLSGTDDFPANGSLNAFYGYFSPLPSFIPGVTYTATSSLLNSYEDDDPRLTLSFNPNEDIFNVIKYVGEEYDEIAEVTDPGEALSNNNPRILRYADVMLLAAEAIVRSNGSIDQAIDLVNQIRERARNSVSPPSAIPADLAVPATLDEALEIIFNERRLELAVEEGHRWHDLRRRHIAGEIDLTTWDFDSSDPTFQFLERNINFPLPDNEVVESPNLNQNDGY